MLSKVPTELLDVPQWIAWKEIGDANRKVPFNPHTGQPAAAGDPTTWGTFDEALKLYGQGGFAGLGFEFLDDDTIVGIDLDGCRDPGTGTVADWARNIIVRLNSYAEVSPSKTGVKIFARGKSPWQSGKKKDLAVGKVTESKNPGIEVYDKKRYFAVTGLRLFGLNRIVDVSPEDIKDLFDSLPEVTKSRSSNDRMTTIERAERYLEKCEPAVDGSSGHNTTFKTACAIVLGFCLTPEEALPIFSRWNQRCVPPWSEKDLIRKLHEANKQSGERGYLRDSNLQNIAMPTVKPPEEINPSDIEPEPVKSLTLDEACYEYIKKMGETPDLDTTGLRPLDIALDGGISRGELILLAARPSHGKSMFALQMMHHLSTFAPGLIISEEMTAASLGKRTIQFASAVHQEYWFKESGKVKSDMRDYFTRREPVYIVESTRTAEKAANAIRAMREKNDVRFAAVDYVQMLAGNSRNRYESVTEASLILRQVANETGVTLLVLAQLNRGIESRESFVPKLSDLKESGQLEQDADVVLFLVWPHRMDSSRDPSQYQIFVSKNRNRGIINAAFDCEFNPSRQMIQPEPIEKHENYNESFSEYE